MSGGTFEGSWSSWGLAEVSAKIHKENPLFADLLKDVNHMIDRYDYYLACDIDEKDINAEWKAFRKKWIEVDEAALERIKAEAVAEADSYVDRIIKGYDERPKFWEEERCPPRCTSERGEATPTPRRGRNERHLHPHPPPRRIHGPRPLLAPR